jgi:DNA modification methylase
MGKSTSREKTLFSGQPKAGAAVSYAGDKPNPELRAFVERHMAERPYDPSMDDYEVPAFDKTIEATKATAIYNMHTYWSKKPHDAIRQYIRHYTKSGDLVLDPFCGSGGTALAALMEGRKVIAIDRSPAATFITKNYCTPVDPDELREAFEQVKSKVQDEIDWLYETRCDNCGGKATTAYTVYSQVFQCPRCLEKVTLFDCVEVDGETAAGKPKKLNVCPYCHTNGHEEVIRSQSKKYGSVPVMVVYNCLSGCRPSKRQRHHLDEDAAKRRNFRLNETEKLKVLQSEPIPHWYPRGFDMTTFDRYQRDALFYYEVKEVADLFTRRNLRALAALRSAIADFPRPDLRDAMMFSFNACILAVSRMVRASNTATMPGTYYMPQVSKEVRVLDSFESKLNVAIKGFGSISTTLSQRDGLISTQSATDLEAIHSNSVDYVFTDPPYSGTIQYGELNYVWEAWLNADVGWLADEMTVSHVRDKAESDWAAAMSRFARECFRVLKPGRWVSLCYHDTAEGTWGLLQDIMTEAGFVPDAGASALFIDAVQKTFNQRTADKVTKRDLVVNFRKPRPGEAGGLRVVIPEGADAKTFADLARQIIRDYLQANPASTKDRVFDELVSRMVRAGQMQAHNFEELLREVADETKDAGGASRWYLKESEEGQIDAAEAAKEDSASKAMEKFITKTLEKNYAEGVHYSDLFEHYLYAVKDKPRRSLADWLPDYFFKTEDGTWRLPVDDDERDLKATARASGENRRIKRYAAMLQAGVAVPKERVPSAATLAEWIRHAKRSGLYEAGKLLYERGGLDASKLSEEQQVEVEEDYQVCVRALQRAAGGEVATTGKKKGRKKKPD